jgi:hypothetical protein
MIRLGTLLGSAAIGLVVAAAACSGDEATGNAANQGGGGDSSAGGNSTSSGTGANGAGGQGGEGAQGGGGFTPTCVETTGTVLAVNELFMGDTDRDGAPSAVAWMQYGFNLDNLVSTPASTDVCQPANGGSPNDAYPDGDAGIDNSFGRNVVPILQGFQQDFSVAVNASIQAGETTLMLHLTDLAAGADQAPIVTRLYGGSPMGSAPAFDGTDCWPVVREQLQDPGDIESAQTTYDTSTLVANHWESATTGDVTLTITIAGLSATFVVHAARFSMDVDPDHQGATLGQLGGVLDTDEFVTEIRRLAGFVNPVLCTGVVDSILNQIRQASDIMNDGTQDPTATCNGISIGIGFNMTQVQLGGIGPEAPAPIDPCR